MVSNSRIPRKGGRPRKRIGGAKRLYLRNGTIYVEIARGINRSTGHTQEEWAALSSEEQGAIIDELSGACAASHAKSSALLDLSTQWIAVNHGYTRRTAETYSNRVTAFVVAMHALGVVTPHQVTHAVLDQWRTTRMAETSRANVNRDEDPVRVWFAWMLKNGHIRRNVWAERERVREPKRTEKKSVPSVADVLDVADWLERQKYGLGPALTIRLALHTGMRLDELRHLQAEHCGRDEKDRAVIRVVPEAGPAKEAWTTKGYRERVIPVHESVLVMADDFLDWRDSPRSINRQRRPALGAGWLAKQIDRARDALNAKRDERDQIPPLRPHDLRRLFVTVSARSGVHLDVVQRWAGHAQSSTTERYLVSVRGDETITAPLFTSDRKT